MIDLVKEIMHDPIFLGGKSETANLNDLSVGEDLLDTLKSHSDECVGMAANMIGVKKRIIAFDNNGKYEVMYNPVIIKKSDSFQTEEGCLSLLGGPRPVKRYRSIKVQYQNEKFQTRLKTYKGWTARIIQHEVDHLEGILI